MLFESFESGEQGWSASMSALGLPLEKVSVGKGGMGEQKPGRLVSDSMDEAVSLKFPVSWSRSVVHISQARAGKELM